MDGLFVMQRLEETRNKAEAATKAAEKAEQQIAALEVQIPKSEMEVAAQRQRAQDLQERLSELQNATKVSSCTLFSIIHCQVRNLRSKNMILHPVLSENVTWLLHMLGKRVLDFIDALLKEARHLKLYAQQNLSSLDG